jgi:cytochrome c553
VAQLEKFRAGLRGGEGATASARQMAPMAASLPDEQALLDVAAYIASLDSAPSPATVSGDVALGGDYFNQFCGACHGPKAEGNVALHSPALAGSDDWYLMAQLKAFRDGSRGAHPEDRSGRQMRAMAAVLPSEQALADVVAFIRSLAGDSE